MGRILIADDHDSLRAGWRARSPTPVTTSKKRERKRRHREAARGAFDVVVSDLKMGGPTASTCCARRKRSIRTPPSSS